MIFAGAEVSPKTSFLMLSKLLLLLQHHHNCYPIRFANENLFAFVTNITVTHNAGHIAAASNSKTINKHYKKKAHLFWV